MRTFIVGLTLIHQPPSLSHYEWSEPTLAETPEDAVFPAWAFREGRPGCPYTGEVVVASRRPDGSMDLWVGRIDFNKVRLQPSVDETLLSVAGDVMDHVSV